MKRSWICLAAALAFINTFVATALAISYTGATPVLVDAEPVTYMIDPSKVERAITDRTRAILPVHLYGHPADMDALVAVARAHDLVVIEDACQAHGARYKGRRAGSLGDAAAFSFYPGKNLGGFGDGGMVVTSDPEVATRVRLLRNYGGEVKYIHRELGFNRRLDTLQAAILNVKLAHLDTWNEARRRHAAQYTELLAGSGVQTPRAAPWAEPVWHLYTVQLEERDALREYLAARGIETGIHYPIPVHLQECYEQLGYRPGDFPVTEAQASHMVSLPMYPEMSEDAIARIADAVIAFGRELH